MTDPAPVASPAKKTKATKTKPKPATHPKYADMVSAAVAALKERNGSSRQAINKYVKVNYTLGETADTQVKLCMKRMIKSGELTQVKGSGLSGSFKLPVKKTSTKPKAKKAVKKPAAKKPAAKVASKKKPAAKKPAAKKAAKKPSKATPKKSKSTPKKTTTKSATKAPKKAAVKTTKAKKPVKKAPAKKSTKKSTKK